MNEVLLPDTIYYKTIPILIASITTALLFVNDSAYRSPLAIILQRFHIVDMLLHKKNNSENNKNNNNACCHRLDTKVPMNFSWCRCSSDDNLFLQQVSETRRL
ncbi:hypothetical protein GQX74_011732 [Glossina fuscipes]|nr:hypothetical protein GQX74_011732 [Glossina fuscipes]